MDCPLFATAVSIEKITRPLEVIPLSRKSYLRFGAPCKTYVRAELQLATMNKFKSYDPFLRFRMMSRMKPYVIITDLPSHTLTHDLSRFVMHAPARPIVYSFPDASNLSDSLAEYILKAQKESIDKHGRFTVAISGGSLPKTLTALITKQDVRWDKWQVIPHTLPSHNRSSPLSRRVFYADERIVPLDHEDSNHKLAQDTLYSKVPIPPKNIHTINYALHDDLEELADAYEKQLIGEFAQRDSARFPVFDLILLGIGPDGHTASLFPGHELLSENDRWVAYIEDSPKPPPRRVTLTFPVINHAARVAFVATGAGKVKILQDILDTPELGLPAARVRPVTPGQLVWFVDDAASTEVKFAKSEFKL